MRGRYGALQGPAIAMYRKRAYPPERVADAIVDAIVHRREVVPVTPEAWAMYLLKRAAPHTAARVFRAMSGWMERRAVREGART
jgi:hypothetical protein